MRSRSPTRLAAPGARITLAHVDPIETQPTASDRHADSRKMLSEERAGAAIDAKILAVTGSSAARCLHQLAARRRYDLLVVGACHRGALGAPVRRRSHGRVAARSSVRRRDRAQRIYAAFASREDRRWSRRIAREHAGTRGGSRDRREDRRDDRARPRAARAERPIRSADRAPMVRGRQATDRGGPRPARRHGRSRRSGQLRIARRTSLPASAKTSIS